MTTITYNAVRSTASSGSLVYEGTRAVNEYLMFHYASDRVLLPYSFGPKESTNFPARCATLCSNWRPTITGSTKALDLGCAVGGSSFELSRHFDKVIGIDFSQHFINAANEMKSKGELTYEILKSGKVFEKQIARLPEGVDPSKVDFFQGDACNLDPSIGNFDVILASNLMCRVPSPRKFISDIKNFIRPGGHLILISPYSWLEEYTKSEEWFGGYSEDGKDLDSFEELSAFIGDSLILRHREDVPFLIREHVRKFQYGVSDCTVWQKSG